MPPRWCMDSYAVVLCCVGLEPRRQDMAYGRPMRQSSESADLLLATDDSVACSAVGRIRSGSPPVPDVAQAVRYMAGERHQGSRQRHESTTALCHENLSKHRQPCVNSLASGWGDPQLRRHYVFAFIPPGGDRLLPEASPNHLRARPVLEP